jgi:hypothetical protein
VTTVERPDLSRRTALSKSVLTAFDLCNHKAWFAIHDPRPFVPKEKVTFGSAVDAGTEVLIKYARMGETPDLERAMDAAGYIIERDGIDTDRAEVRHALGRFIADILPIRDWSRAQTQLTLRAELPGLGESEGHPDVVLPEEVIDIKTTSGKSAKDPRSVELGFYVLLREAIGDPVRHVTYMEWRRAEPVGSLKVGKWVTSAYAVTDEFRRWTYERAASYVRARKADVELNKRNKARAIAPANYSFPNGPRFPSLCSDCEWSPAVGGPCAIAFLEVA